jgi:RNA polymerase sigma factor (sigma-70 family)
MKKKKKSKMELPDGLTESDFLDSFNRVVKKIAHKYTFTSYETEDIEQEAFLIAIKSLKDYDASRSLDNFLYVHLSNRLKNFKRDNYYRYEVGPAQRIQDSKKALLEPIDINELFHVATKDTTSQSAYIVELQAIVDEHLPANMRGDYLKIKNKGKIAKSRKANVIKKIQEIIDRYEEGK